MGHWNYRIVEDEDRLCLAEVYYDGKKRPWGWCGATFFAEREEGREGVLDALRTALSDAEKAPTLSAAEMTGKAP